MRSAFRSPLPIRAVLCTLLVLALFLSRPCRANVPPPPAPPAPPAGYCQMVYNELNNYLAAFNTTLSSVWNGTRYPVLYAGTVPTANGNSGPQLINSGYFIGVQNQLQELQAMGFKAILVQVEFPILYQPFYSSQSQYQSYVNFYSQVASTARAMGFKIVVENDVLLANDAQAGWTNTTAFYSSLSWTEYTAARAQMAATLAQTMQPDYLVVAEEPDSEASQTGQTNLNTPADAAGMVSQEIAAVRALNLANTKIGAGFGSWVQNLTTYLSDYVALPLDYIDFHIYPVNTEHGQNFLSNALTIASTAAAAGKPVAMSETWLWKMADSEWQVLTPDDYAARDPFSFWAPLNSAFLQTLQNLANYTQMLYQAPSEPNEFFALQTYGGTTANGGAANCMCTTASCSNSQILGTEDSLATAANLQSTFTTTGIGYYNSLMSSADTTPPTTPTSLSGNAGYNQASVTWTASTDNVGVAGYNVIRNGVSIANTAETTFDDSGLATSTTYNYQIQAFDVGGNTSPYSQTLTLTTVNTTPPTTPTNLTATPYSCQQINLSWSPAQSTSGLSSYKIFRGGSPDTLAQVATVNSTTTTYKDQPLPASTTYYYGVEAAAQQNISPMSAPASATTLALPSAPTQLTAVATSSKQINLAWAPSTGGMPIASYHIFRGTSADTLVQVATRTTTSYSDMSLAASTTYYYEVQAADKGGDSSPMSVEVSATTIPLPNPPAGLTATAASATKITLGWTEPGLPGGLPISSYKVFCSTSPSNLSQAGTAKTTSYSCLNLSPGTTYYCAVEAVDTAGDTSTMSATVSATTKALPNMPTNVTATANSATKVTVNWTETVPANGLPISNYKIYRGASPTCLSQVATRTTASYIDTTVSAGTYYYAIQASDTGGDVSAMSVPAAVTVP